MSWKFLHLSKLFHNTSQYCEIQNKHIKFQSLGLALRLTTGKTRPRIIYHHMMVTPDHSARGKAKDINLLWRHGTAFNESRPWTPSNILYSLPMRTSGVMDPKNRPRYYVPPWRRNSDTDRQTPTVCSLYENVALHWMNRPYNEWANSSALIQTKITDRHATSYSRNPLERPPQMQDKNGCS